MATENANLELSVTVGDASFQASGPAQLVMKALGEFKSLIAAGPPRRTSTKDDKPKPDSGTGDGGDIPGIDQPLSVFVKRSWDSQAAKATAIVLWARERASKTALKPAEIADYWRTTSGNAVKNPAPVCADAVKKGWLHNEGGGQYSVTQPGLDAVNAVPRS